MYPVTLPATHQSSVLAEELGLSERLSRMQGQEIGPSDVIKILRAAKVRHLLVGAHAISAWAGDARATLDVDVIAARPAQARDALAQAFPDLSIEEHPVVIRFKRDGREVIDVIRPTSAPIFKAALKHGQAVKIGNLMVDVPQLEMALALKFTSMTSPTRALEDRYQDAHDFIRMVKHNSIIDAERLTAFGELAYAGGGNDLLKLLDDARSGRQLKL
jgi:hypothetical protein